MMAKVRAFLPLLLLLAALWTVEGRGNDGIGRSPVVGRGRPSWFRRDQALHPRPQPAGQDPVGNEPPRRVEGGPSETASLPFVTPTPIPRLELRQDSGGGPGKGTAERPPGSPSGPGGGPLGGPGPGGGGRGFGQNGPESCPSEQQLSSLSSSAASALAAASSSFSATLAALSTQSSTDVAAASATAAASASSQISSAQAAAAAASSQLASANASASAVSSSLVASASSAIAAAQASAAAGATLAPVTLPPTTVTVTMETTVPADMKTTTMTDVTTQPAAQPEETAHADTEDVISSSNLSHGQLAGTLVGSVIGAAIVTFLLVFLYFRRRHHQSTIVFDGARSPGYRANSQAAMRDAEPSAIYPRDEKRNLDGAQPAELSVSPHPVPPRHPSNLGTTTVIGTGPARYDEDPIDFRQWALRSGTGPPGPEPQPVRLQLARKNSTDGTKKVQVVRVPVGGNSAQNPRDSMQDAGRTQFRPARASASESFYSNDIPPPSWAPTAPERAQRRVSGLGPLPPRRSSGQALYANSSRLEPPPKIPRHENVTSWGSWGSALVDTQLDGHMAMLLKQPPLGHPTGSRGPSPTGDRDTNGVEDDVSPPASPRRHHDAARGTLMSLSPRDSHTIPLSFVPLAPPGRQLQSPRKSLPGSRPQMPLSVSQPQLQPAAAPLVLQPQLQPQQDHVPGGTSSGFTPSYAATSRASSHGGSSRPSTGAGLGGLRPPPPFSLFPSPGPSKGPGAPTSVPAPLVPGGGGAAGLGIQQQQAYRLSLTPSAAQRHSHPLADDAARASAVAGGGGPSRFHWPLSPRFPLKPDPRI